MLNIHAACKYENPYKGPFVEKNYCTNGPVTLQYGLTKISNNLRWIKLYTSDTNIKDINTENMYVNIKI